MTNIVLKGKDNSVAIMTLAPGADKDEAIRKFRECHPGFYNEYFEDVKLPEDRSERDNWRFNSKNEIVIKK